MLMNKNQLNKLRDTFFSWNFISENKKKTLLKGSMLQKIHSIFIVRFTQVKWLSRASSHQEEGGK